MAHGEQKDPYTLLGVARDADEASIRKAYRKLARELHPDVNPGDNAAEERFKRVSAAYAVLSDPAKRSAFDEFGESALDPNFDAARARAAGQAFGQGFGRGPAGGGFGGIDDLFSNLFSRGGRGGFGGAPLRRAGPNLEAELSLDFIEAALGGEQRLTISRPTVDGAHSGSITVRIPPGVADGGRIRLRGKGGDGIGGAPPGDLLVRIHVRPHPLFRREGRDLYVDVPISVKEAILGAKVEIPTLTGRITLSIPPGTDSGAKLRLRGKGVPHPSGGDAGDLYVVAQIKVPRDLDSSAKARVEELTELDVPDLRRHLE